MASNGGQQIFLVIRHHATTGGGRTEVLHREPGGREHPVFQHDSQASDNWAEDLDPTLQDSLGRGIVRTILDLADVEWVNSTGLGVIMSLCSRIEKGGGTVVLANPSPKVANILKVTKLDRHFTIVDSVAAAVEHYSREGLI